MRNILKWIILSVIIIIFLVLLIHFSNKNKTNNNKTKEPVVYERPISNLADDESNLVEINTADENSYQVVENVEVGDTGSRGEVYICFGMFVLLTGIYYIRRYRLQ